MATIFILPLFGRMAACSLLETFIGIPSDLVLFGVSWQAMVEFMLSIFYLNTLIRFIRGFEVEDGEWLQSEMLASWMKVTIRGIYGAVILHSYRETF
jgi:Na+-transporting NADH:ubiquinone oxidoreductase subunit NqrB